MAVVLCLAVVLAVVHLSGSAEGQGWVSRAGAPAGKAKPTSLGVGLIQYDPGPPADFLLAGPSLLVGNRFDSRNGTPLSSGTITAFAAYWGGQDATFPVFAAVNTANTVAFGSTFVPGLVPFTFNTVAVSWPVPPTFMGIVVVSSFYPSSADSVGIRSASYNGQGFHGVSAPNVFGSPFNALSGQNAMVRVSGTMVVPVELMEFDVE